MHLDTTQRQKNLAEHGIHPRITHAVVNMPMLFGPLILVAYITMFEEIVGGRNNKTVKEMQQFTNTICKWSIVSGLLVLSCAPHQEPRFLLPVIVPLVFLYGQNVASGVKESGSTKNSLVIILKRIISSPLFWVFFNLILYVFFGWLQQGGLIDSLLHKSSNNVHDQPPLVSIYYKTYMPPTFLTRRESIAKSKQDICQARDIDSVTEEGKICMATDLQSHQTTILDLQGSQPSVLLEVLRNIIPCTSEGEGHIHLISPPAVVLQLIESRNEISTGMKWEEYSIMFTRDYNAHISTEDWPAFDDSFLQQLKLDVYTVTCNL